jgi:hypothetical protein
MCNLWVITFSNQREVKEVDTDLKGSQNAEIYAYGANADVAERPLVYILKDSYVK